MSLHTGNIIAHAGAMCIIILLISLADTGVAKSLRAPASIYPNGDGVTEVNLSISAQRLRLPLEAESKHGQLYLEYTARLYSWNDSSPTLPGPTIHVMSGGTLKIQLTNALGDEVLAPSSLHMYTFHAPNHSNLHFHGVHGDPAVDDPFVSVAPGQSHTYVLPILADHLPGLHWYHTHYHGSVYYHVMGGLFGALVIDPTEQSDASHNHVIDKKIGHLTCY